MELSVGVCVRDLKGIGLGFFHCLSPCVISTSVVPASQNQVWLLLCSLLCNCP